MSEATADTEPLVGGEHDPRRVRIDRFEIVRELGAGGMGVVYEARDPHLDRTVAIKIVRGAATDDARARLVREARAMAKVADANIVTVFDAGSVHTDVWIAMEYIAGRTLRAWVRERPRSWREVVHRLVLAGRGLAAAHAAGLVHRDFKPENVLLGDDGRVCVADFGLAHGPDAPGDAGATNGSRSSFAGTPAYMSPEQHLGRATDARSDQFAFCVTLWEILYGQRPYVVPEGSDPAIVAAATVDGRISDPPRDANVPAWLERALRRGLAVDPDQRWPDLAALLDEIDRVPRRRRRLAITAGLAVTMTGLIALAVALVVVVRSSGQSEPEPETADEAYRKGEVAYNLGDFPTAVANFKRGFELEPSFDFKSVRYLYNLGQAYRQMGDCVDAQLAFGRYLAVSTHLTPKRRADVEGVIRSLDACAAQQRLLGPK